MGIFNDNVNNPHTTNPCGGIQGYQNYDIDNKKLTKVAEGTDNGDSVNKHQMDSALNTKINKSEASVVGNPEANKLVRYLPDKGLITSKLYIEDAFNDSVIIESDDQ